MIKPPTHRQRAAAAKKLRRAEALIESACEHVPVDWTVDADRVGMPGALTTVAIAPGSIRLGRLADALENDHLFPEPTP